MTDQKILNTIEDLVAFAVAKAGPAGKDVNRYSLGFRSGEIWVNEEQGKAWERDLQTVASQAWENAKAAGLDKWEAESQAHKKFVTANPRPEKKNVMYFWLTRAGSSSRFHTTYELSEELGKQLYAIWAKNSKQHYLRMPDAQGTLSLQGMIKRLGKTDTGDLMAAAQAAAQAAQAKAIRNSLRARLVEQSKTLTDTLVRAKEKGIEIPFELVNAVEMIRVLGQQTEQ